MCKKCILIAGLYIAGFFSAVYLLGSAEAANCSKAEVIADKLHAQFCKVVKLVDEKASKVGNKATERLAKR